jgi:hypothetical protein
VAVLVRGTLELCVRGGRAKQGLGFRASFYQ